MTTTTKPIEEVRLGDLVVIGGAAHEVRYTFGDRIGGRLTCGLGLDGVRPIAFPEGTAILVITEEEQNRALAETLRWAREHGHEEL